MSAAAGRPGAQMAPLWGTLLALWGALALLLVLSLRLTGGHLVYGLDDPYIHMSLAKTLAGYGDWGFFPGRFDSASSSPLWVLLLALGDLFLGERSWLPFAIDTLVASLILIWFDGRLRRAGKRPRFRFLALILLAFGAPMPALIFGGMEHLLHGFFALLCLDLVLERLDGAPRRPLAPLLAAAFALVALRDEGLFLLLPSAALLALRRRRLEAGALLSASLSPVLLYALFSRAKGGAWLPDPILLKGKGMALGSAASWWHSLWGPLYYHLRSPLSPFSVHVMAFLLLGALLWLVRRPRAGFWERGQLSLLIFVPALLAQYCFAGTGYLFRYEAWLVMVGITVLIQLPEMDAAPSIPRSWGRWRWPLSGLVLVLLVALGARGVVALERLPRATRNIYEQQYQMGRFLAEHYAGAAVALNDIGATNYLAPIRSLDLFGHSQREIGRLRREGAFDAARMEAFTRAAGCRIAVVYEIWFDALPASWRKVGEWTIRDNTVCAHDTVSFFALDDADWEPLRLSFLDYSRRRLPARVGWRLAAP